VVVVADDAGLAASSDDAIVRCVRAGIVRNVSLFANGDTAAELAGRAMVLGACVGLHVNLTQGVALAGPSPTLTDGAGRFLGKQEVWRRAVAGALDPAAVRREVRAQWERVGEFGVRPTHVDGHNHVHVLAAVRDALRECAAGLWFRAPRDGDPPPADLPGLPGELGRWSSAPDGPWRFADAFSGFRFSREPTAEVLLASLEGGAHVTELMVHPGARPGSPFTSSPLRERECGVLCDPALAGTIARLGLRVASFAELSCA
jgi:predicted glycoside hydrolase/deacetylase ChbG (UPF0249 family)